jgi:hypothetical protein
MLGGREMRTHALPEGDFGKTFVPPMQDVTQSGDAVADIWPYVLAIPRAELGGLAFREGVVEHVYRSADARFDHVLIPTSVGNLFIVVIVARDEKAIRGHHVLDLNEKYGLKPPRMLEALQLAREVCSRQNVVPEAIEPGATVGIALDTLHLEPLNGLRLRAEGDTSGWYVWGGDILREDSDFFQPLHLSHLFEHCPSVLPYLALPPGWRFLLGSNGHVDVWYDESVLDE